MYVAVLDLLRSSTLLTRVIYGVRVERKILSLNWDLTTIVLKKAIDTEFGAAARDVLDMGCGHLAILGQYIKKRHPESRVTSVDIYQELLDNAALNARENAVAISFVRSDLYENVKGPYNCIVFNPPYIPVDSKPLPYPKTGYSGPDGTETMRAFLGQSKPYLAPGGMILLGVNCFYVPYEKVLAIIDEYGYVVRNVVSRRFNTSKAFVIQPNG
ncbi:MAG: hypothetical protein A3K19_13075 [Lentisphaerae bacterium RIFOXYB12_FULL_65_16]|nr:MAG: hypothetical protein A3K18_04630 [Lentisphaerae bacterium RIFOXYA12_64_32]OGV87242.1 MAG: hypothetical protein A3K19_13075 [Lentisphaerae bacterium RIFOXYB12_FULL_65_16]